MRNAPTGSAVALTLALLTLVGLHISAQVLPNPYRIVEGWAKLPNGRAMGAVGKIAIDPDGRRIWAVVRCERLEDPARFGDECRDSKTDPVVKSSPEGKVLKSFGGGMFIWPHGIDVDKEGNVWVRTRSRAIGFPKAINAGMSGRKFHSRRGSAADARHAGRSRNRAKHLTRPATWPWRQTAMSSSPTVMARRQQPRRAIRKGRHLHQGMGEERLGTREFHQLHAIAIDSRGRVFVGDPGHNRIKIFDQDGKSLTVPWTQFGKPSGIAFDSKDQIYVADSESDDVQNPGEEEIQSATRRADGSTRSSCFPGRSADDGRHPRVRGGRSGRERLRRRTGAEAFAEIRKGQRRITASQTRL